jgi:polysaccharide pyruvyl transferase WcaK-like protein
VIYSARAHAGCGVIGLTGGHVPRRFLGSASDTGLLTPLIDGVDTASPPAPRRTAADPSEERSPNRPRTIYMTGAGGVGNIGAEAIFLALVRMFQRRWPDARFVLSAWRPERVRALVADLSGDFRVIRQSIPLDRPRELRAADVFVVCGDVALTETVIPILPTYWAAKALWASLFGAQVVFLGIEVESVRRWLNRWVIRRVLNRVVRYYVSRNEESHASLARLSADPGRLLLGCEPALMITDDDLAPFPAPRVDRRGADLLVGFGVRDHFAEPLRLDWRRAKLRRRDARPGELSPTTREAVSFLARLADRLIERYGARVVFIPHHSLTGREKVILTDRDVARRIVQGMRHPEGTVTLPEDLHPFAAMNVYRELDLVVSMRHHASSFAYRFGVPTIGCAISEKIVRHFRQVQQESLLVDPLDPDPGNAERVLDAAVQNRRALSDDLKTRLGAVQAAMSRAMNVVSRGLETRAAVPSASKRASRDAAAPAR